MTAHSGYEIRSVYDAKEVLDKVCPGKMEWDGLMIKMNSQRYRLFKRSCKCVRCGIEGTLMYLEKPIKSDETNWHFNLYAVKDDGTEVLMTKDHIIPKSIGGKNILENYQTMCAECNSKKGNALEQKYMIAVARTNRLRDDFMVEFTGGFKDLQEAWCAALGHLWAEHPETLNMRKLAILHVWAPIEFSNYYFDKNKQKHWWKPLFMGVTNGPEDDKKLRKLKASI